MDFVRSQTKEIVAQISQPLTNSLNTISANNLEVYFTILLRLFANLGIILRLFPNLGQLTHLKKTIYQHLQSPSNSCKSDWLGSAFQGASNPVINDSCQMKSLTEQPHLFTSRKKKTALAKTLKNSHLQYSSLNIILCRLKSWYKNDVIQRGVALRTIISSDVQTLHHLNLWRTKSSCQMCFGTYYVT